MAAPSKPSPSVVTGGVPPPAPKEAEKPDDVVVETPTSPSSGLALSRFEFETDKGNEGTKILMVDWDTSAGMEEGGGGDGGGAGDWEVSWEGKTTVLPIRDTAGADSALPESEEGSSSTTRRVYFLLPPGAPIPPLITITKKGRKGSSSSGGGGGPELRTKPMPAIFHPSLGVGTRDVGKRGVLHTIWAKKRLSELQREIDVEMRTNGEGVGLEMALQERDWIVEHFGVPGVVEGPRRAAPPPPPASPRSPVGKLGEKLRGLKLATSPGELAAASQAARRQQQAQISSLSPQAADVAVSSFASFHGAAAATAAAATSGTDAPAGGGLASLDAIIGGAARPPPPPPEAAAADTEEDLFALPMSPRSPEMKRSPFSLL